MDHYTGSRRGSGGI